jgi:hypothetical protein
MPSSSSSANLFIFFIIFYNFLYKEYIKVLFFVQNAIGSWWKIAMKQLPETPICVFVRQREWGCLKDNWDATSHL